VVGGRGQAEVDRDSEAPGGVLRHDAQTRERSSGESPGEASVRKALEGRNPREQPVGGALIPRRPPGTLARVKAQEPRPAGPVRRFGDGLSGRKNGTWAHSVMKAAEYLARGQGSEG
jgi:hypothetical protein